MRCVLYVAPAEEALTLQEVKDHLRETGTGQDKRIDSLIKAARLEYEKFTNRILMSSTWDLYLDAFPDKNYIALPGPVSLVTSVKYQDTADAQQTLSATTAYDSDLISDPARVYLRYGQSWPSTYDEFNAVVVRFVAGYANADAVPEHIKNGLYLYIAHMYENREPLNIGNIVNPINPWEACWWGERVVPV